MINVLVSLPKGQADTITDAFDTLDDALQQALAFVPATSWGETDFPAPPSRILDIIVTPEALAVIEAEYPAGRVLAAFNLDGSQVGTTITVTVDENGDVTETITGTPTYPINTSRMVAAMPPIVVRDVDGTVLSTTPQTVLSDNLGHTWAGWSGRRYS